MPASPPPSPGDADADAVDDELELGPEHALVFTRSTTSPVAQVAPAPALPELWRVLQNAIRARVQPEQFETWFRRAALVHADAEQVRIAVQNGFTRDWLLSYYRDVLDQAVQHTLGTPRRIEFVVDPELLVRVARDAQDPRPEARPVAPGSSTRSSSATIVSDRRTAGADGAPLRIESSGGLLWSSDVHLNPKYVFDNFVVGPCNRFAHAASVGVSEAPGKAYNPFFLHGNVGLGKTHLLQSLCFALLERDPKTRILYLSCETFVNHFINALENVDLAKFMNKYRKVDVLVVDDIHLLANKERTQEEFFHTFNTLYQSGKQIVLSSDSPPKDIPTLQERLVSRFKWGLVTEIEPPCYETRMAILKRKSRDRGREIPDDVARLLAERVDSNIRELEGAVVKLIGYAGLAGAPVSVDLARDALRELFELRKGAPSMEEIVALVTEHFGVKIAELQSKKRTNAVAYPRQIAMYLARQITRHSLEEIGGFFGGRDHSTVIYAVDKIGQLIQADETVRALVDGFMQRLQAPSR
ncbi:MAG: chromosomal replication initiator protein DnaA [Planctomycetes bacterium]|nr:chromosomal replication initiator protein DnaA [Planctomycetota bacterium]